MTVALAGTLGVGNIVGVASAITLGGAGAIFWMWVSALCAMALKYAEITLALRHRRRAADGTMLGGAMYYIRDCVAAGPLGRRGGRVLGGFFALLCLANALTMGSVIQVRAVSSAFAAVAGVPTVVVGIAVAVLVLLALRRGVGGVAKLTERLIPLASAGYVLVSLLALFRLRGQLPAALASIFTSAFTPAGAAGGVTGFLLSRSIRYGTMRGLLSNEAGCGTAPAAHAESTAAHPAEQGIWGIVEVFVDTILLCTMTALVILAAGVDTAEPDGMLAHAACLYGSARQWGKLVSLRGYSGFCLCDYPLLGPLWPCLHPLVWRRKGKAQAVPCRLYRLDLHRGRRRTGRCLGGRRFCARCDDDSQCGGSVHHDA